MTPDVCRRRFVAAAATLTLMFGVAVWGQSKGEPAARDADEAFDVISVKRHPGERARNASAMRPGGRFQSESSLRQLIRYAYQLQPYQRVVGSSAILDQLFVIEARVAPERVRGRDGHFPMVRALLRDRFKLRVRFEDETQTVAAIVRRADRLGPNLRALPYDCAAPRPEPSPDPPPAPCVLTIIDGRLKAIVSSMEDFARRLSLSGGAFVDATGLTGPFQIEMQFDPASLNDKYASATPSEFPSLADAMQKDLGLGLENRRRPVPVLIVESVEAPTEN